MSGSGRSTTVRAAVFRLLADPCRLRVIELLMRSRRTLSVGEIAEVIDMSHSATSHVLGVLFRAGVVENEREGREKLYRYSNSPHARRIRAIIAES